MNNENDPLMRPWHPMTDPVAVKTLGKLGEEAGELCQIVCRCLIQGIDETDPTKDITNREWLENELADVAANLRLVKDYFDLDTEKINKRITEKMERLKRWHEMA